MKSCLITDEITVEIMQYATVTVSLPQYVNEVL